MTIIRSPRVQRDFTIISNSVCLDARLSMRALGLLVRLLCRPDNWQTNSETLAREFDCGRDQIRGVLKELSDAGYMRLEKSQNAKGHWESRWFVLEEPAGDDQPSTRQPATGKQGFGGSGPIPRTDLTRTDNNHTLPLPEARKMVQKFINSAPKSDAQSFHAGVIAEMLAAGWVVESEVAVDDRGDGRIGRVDILVTKPCVIGIELDRASPREKSVFKLKQIRGYKMIGLRVPGFSGEIAGIDAVISPESVEDVLPDGFADFWSVYPKKIGKDAAITAWNRKVKTPETIRAILEAVKAQAQSDAWKKDGGQFIPNPATWLNQGRWKDEGASAADTSSARYI